MASNQDQVTLATASKPTWISRVAVVAVLSLVWGALASPLVSKDRAAQAAEPPPGPYPAACPEGTPAPFSSSGDPHDNCIRSNEYASMSVDTGEAGVGDTVTLTLGFISPECERKSGGAFHPNPRRTHVSLRFQRRLGLA